MFSVPPSLAAVALSPATCNQVIESAHPVLSVVPKETLGKPFHAVRLEFRDKKTDDSPAVRYMSGKVQAFSRDANGEISSITITGFTQARKENGRFVTLEAHTTRTFQRKEIIEFRDYYTRATQDTLEALASSTASGKDAEGTFLVKEGDQYTKYTGEISQVIRTENGGKIRSAKIRISQTGRTIDVPVENIHEIDFQLESTWFHSVQPSKRPPGERFPEPSIKFPLGSSYGNRQFPRAERTEEPIEIERKEETLELREADLLDLRNQTQDLKVEEVAELREETSHAVVDPQVFVEALPSIPETLVTSEAQVTAIVLSSPTAQKGHKFSDLKRSPLDGDLIEGYVLENDALVHKQFDVPADYIEKFQKPLDRFLEEILGTEAGGVWDRRTSLVTEPEAIRVELIKDLQQLFGNDPRLRNVAIHLLGKGGMHKVYQISAPRDLSNDPRFPTRRILRASLEPNLNNLKKNFPHASDDELQNIKKVLEGVHNNTRYAFVARELGISYMAQRAPWNLPVIHITSDPNNALRGWTFTNRAIGPSASHALEDQAGFVATDEQKVKLMLALAEIEVRIQNFTKYSRRYFYSRLKGHHLAKRLNGKYYSDVTGFDAKLPEDVLLIPIHESSARLRMLAGDPWVVQLNRLRTLPDGSIDTELQWYETTIRDF